MKLRFTKTPRISFFLYVVGDPRAIFVQKKCGTRNETESL